MRSVRVSVLVLGSLLALAACGEAHQLPPRAVDPRAGQLRVMSYNVNFGLQGDRAAVEAIAGARPDVVFLQETNAPWASVLVSGLGERYPHRRFTEPKTWPAGGMGLLSRYPIAALDELPSHGGPFFAWRAVLDTPVGRIQVLSVHLRPPMSDGGSWVVGYFSTREDREREIQYHHASLDPDLPTLVVGDFNEEGDGRAVQFLVDHGFADALGAFVGGRRTWEWPVGGITLRFQLDHLMHDVHFIPVAAAVVEAGRSDHMPIWADFERAQE